MGGEGMRPYGYELLLDLHECNEKKFTRSDLGAFFSRLCELIDMQECEVHFWDDFEVPIEEQQQDSQTKGTSAVCFILTSSIVVHTLDILKAVYVNIFSCKEFDPGVAAKFTEQWFEADPCKPTFIKRM